MRQVKLAIIFAVLLGMICAHKGKPEPPKPTETVPVEVIDETQVEKPKNVFLITTKLTKAQIENLLHKTDPMTEQIEPVHNEAEEEVVSVTPAGVTTLKEKKNKENKKIEKQKKNKAKKQKKQKKQKKPIKPEPVEPIPVEPIPIEPIPIEPTPIGPMPEPMPVPIPVEPIPFGPMPVEPMPVEPTPEPTPVEPTPEEPTPVEPIPVEPIPVEPIPVEPTPVEPTPVEPTPEHPTPVEPTPEHPTKEHKEPITPEQTTSLRQQKTRTQYKQHQGKEPKPTQADAKVGAPQVLKVTTPKKEKTTGMSYTFAFFVFCIFVSLYVIATQYEKIQLKFKEHFLTEDLTDYLLLDEQKNKEEIDYPSIRDI